MNNSKKYLAVGVFILVFILIILSLLQSLTAPKNIPPNSPFPTSVSTNQYSGGSTRTRGSSSSINQGNNSSVVSNSVDLTDERATSQMNELKKKLPLETNDFILKYSPNLDKLVVTRKTPSADQAFSSFATGKNYPLLVDNPKTTIISDKTMEQVQTPYATKSPEQQLGTIVTLFNLLLQPPVINTPVPTLIPTLIPTATPILSSSQSSQSSINLSSSGSNQNGYVYYSQCQGSYDSYPLAEGCNVCQAGCGPVTVSMILSSYIDQKYTPPEVVEIYKSNGWAACGTGLSYAKSVLTSRGVKTSDYILPYSGIEYSIEEVRGDFKSYLDNGWTIFVLAWFREGKGGGHYFWVTGLDENGNVLAYDPYYGASQSPPINENVRYPFPKYAAAFAVKK
ncbi:C39 family peptidase [Candidatus Roizmanbacteria bacterium]|nr:C39 family peptidase [Candidatus Roizmanbacteria bacterium]